MTSIKEMAEAHVKTIENTIADLERQSLNLKEEIDKLKNYLGQCIESLSKEV